MSSANLQLHLCGIYEYLNELTSGKEHTKRNFLSNQREKAQSILSEVGMIFRSEKKNTLFVVALPRFRCPFQPAVWRMRRGENFTLFTVWFDPCVTLKFSEKWCQNRFVRSTVTSCQNLSHSDIDKKARTNQNATTNNVTHVCTNLIRCSWIFFRLRFACQWMSAVAWQVSVLVLALAARQW